MRIDYLQLINFKSFEDLKHDFKPGVNLLVGANGSGKTALLEGLSVALGGFFATRLPGVHQRTIRASENRLFEGFSAGNTTVLAKIGEDLTWSRTFNAETSSNDNKFIEPIKNHAKPYFEALKQPEDVTIVPLISYQSTERLHNPANRISRSNSLPEYKEGRRLGYWRALSDQPLYETIQQWIMDAWQNRIAFREKDLPLNTNQPLENVELAVNMLLNEFSDSETDQYVQLFIDARFKKQLCIAMGKRVMPVSYYSDGYRALIQLIIDLVWRASILNPKRTLQDLIQELNGVVLIDEIDLHLHPRWQAKAIPFLQSLFPMVQFFITTHSPVVVANFDRNETESQDYVDGIFVLNGSGEGEVIQELKGDYFGQDVNSVITKLQGFDARAPRIQGLIDEFNKITRQTEYSNEDALRSIEIAKELEHHIPSTDPVMVRILATVEKLKIQLA